MTTLKQPIQRFYKRAIDILMGTKSIKRETIRVLVITCFCSVFQSLSLGFAQSNTAQIISEKTNGLIKAEGFYNTYYDAAKDQLWLEVELSDGSMSSKTTDFLYVNSLAAGIGSNDIGLDRGQLGDTRVVYFERRGPKLLMVQPNLDYRADTENPLEKKSVQEAFASSILWGFEITAEEENRVLIDLTAFLLRDAHGVSERLQSSGQGSYSVDKSRSALYTEAILNFPDNSEFEAILTFNGTRPGGWVRSVTPTPEAVTVRQHHSFIRLPDGGYEKREYDPRAGYFGISYQDYGTPITESLVKRFIARHRLEKKDPEADVSEPVEPIIYYLDNGTPEPVRSALLDGARWWNQAFEAAGYKDAFQVEILPEDAHPLDVRYNVIQWIHRSTRGWSYGASVTDPRTGEIIKGHVSLGSLRVRQDYLIANGLTSPFTEDWAIKEDATKESLDMALARIRQLSAHEVGHTIGIMHNFAASTNQDASVMDYPHPQPSLYYKDGEVIIDLSTSYDTGIGEWDKLAVRYGYEDFPDGINQKEALNQILEEGYATGLRFIADQDARAQGGAHPYAHLWDFGSDPVQQLNHIMEIRRVALDRFDESVLPDGRALAEMEDVLVPIYFFHRYQVEATVKLVGGLDYTYRVKGDNSPVPTLLDDQVQRAALEALLNTLRSDELAVPEPILSKIPPRPAGIQSTRELFRGNTGPTLDALAIAETAAELTVSLLLHPERANRLVEYSARSGSIGLEDVIQRLLEISWYAQREVNTKGSRKTGRDRDERSDSRISYEDQVDQVVLHVVLRNLLALAASETSNPVTKAITYQVLKHLKSYVSESTDYNEMYAAHLLELFFHNPETFQLPQPPAPPPGAPIGMGSVCTIDF